MQCHWQLMEISPEKTGEALDVAGFYRGCAGSQQSPLQTFTADDHHTFQAVDARDLSP
jgi:hypothetical protein